MKDEATVTLRVPRSLKESIDEIAHDLRISQSAVWKILISHYLRVANADNARETVERVTAETVHRHERRDENRVRVR